MELNLDELLLATTEEGLTPLHLAAHKNQTDLLQKLWVWAEEWQLNRNELRKIVTSQRHRWVYCMALCSVFWEIRGITVIKEFG